LSHRQHRTCQAPHTLSGVQSRSAPVRVVLTGLLSTPLRVPLSPRRHAGPKSKHLINIQWYYSTSPFDTKWCYSPSPMSLQEHQRQKRQPNRPQPQAPPLTPDNISFTQLDIPKDFGVNERLGPEEWAPTVPLNATTPFPGSRGLPPLIAKAEEIHAFARRLSRQRVAIADPSDGVYCPVCHIANTQLSKLHTPCPKCHRALLRFGWD
jgi:hypothetical protein